MSSWSGVTGSAAYATAACPARAALPQCRSAGEAADRGNAIHDYARRVSRRPELKEQFLGEISDKNWRQTCAGMNLGAALEGIKVLGQEVAFALDVKAQTCRLIGENIGRRYNGHLIACGKPELGPYEIPFTVDILGESEVLGCPVELDYKSGQSIGTVEDHGQRRVSATGLMLYYGTDTCVSRVAYIWDSGEIVHDGHEFMLLDAYETCDFLAEMIDDVNAAKALLASGTMPTVYADRDEQCRYCAAMDVCPYWNNLTKGALGKLKAITAGPDLVELTPSDRGQILDYVKDVKKIAGELEDRLKAFALKGPLPIDEGYEFRAKEMPGRSFFDAAEARGLLMILMGRLGMTEEQIEDQMKSLTKKGASYPEVRRRKRELPVVKKQRLKKAS